jgi:DUF917 family protein
MPDFFHHGHGINLFFRVLSKVNKNIEKFFNIGHVKISGHNEITASPVILTQEWMYIFNAVQTVSSVPQMP